MKDFKDLYKAAIQAFQLLIKGNFLHFFIPGIILTIISYLLYSGGQSTIKAFDFLENIPWIGTYLISAKNTAFGWMIGIGGFIYQFIILTLFSPINTLLSEKVETKVTGRVFRFGLKEFVRDFIRLLGIVSVGLVFYLTFYFFWLILAKIVGLQFLSPLISFVLTSFFTGFNSYDYSLERHKIGTKKSWKYAFNNPLQMILTGAIYSGMIYIPMIGMILAPVLSTLIATLIFIENNGSKNQGEIRLRN